MSIGPLKIDNYWHLLLPSAFAWHHVKGWLLQNWNVSYIMHCISCDEERQQMIESISDVWQSSYNKKKCKCYLTESLLPTPALTAISLKKRISILSNACTGILQIPFKVCWYSYHITSDITLGSIYQQKVYTSVEHYSSTEYRQWSLFCVFCVK